jgi:predicted HicB family RNase H-like nuclease
MGLKRFNDQLQYKDFIGSVNFSANDQIYYGKIEGISDLVTFEGNTVQTLTQDFHQAVEDYIKDCKDLGRPVFISVG